MQTTQIIIALIASTSTMLGYLLINWLNKPKQKKETENIVVETMEVVIKELRAEREDDRKQIQLNKEEAVRARTEAKLAAEQNDDCEFEHGITRMQLNKVMKKLEMHHWIKSSVFVLDDNEMVIKVFTQRFKTVPVVFFKAFTDWKAFLVEAQREKPEILVLDHMLSDDRTATDVIRELGYDPEIFIMSGNKDFEVLYKDTDVKFFYKDRFYIRNITKAIMEHLIIKNQ